MGSSRTRDQTCVSCIGRRILNHYTKREVPLFRYCMHFLIRLFIFLLLRFKSSLNILDTSPFSDMFFTNIFLLVCGLSFHSLDGIFQRAEVLNFNEIQLNNYFFILFWHYTLKTHCWDFPGGTVVKNPPANAGDTGLISDLGKSHVPQSS